jgi:hypothetical protein
VVDRAGENLRARLRPEEPDLRSIRKLKLCHILAHFEPAKATFPLCSPDPLISAIETPGLSGLRGDCCVTPNHARGDLRLRQFRWVDVGFVRRHKLPDFDKARNGRE